MHIKEKFSTQTAALMLLDALLVTLSGGIALLVRFEFSIAEVPEQYATNWLHFLPFHILATAAVFYLRKMYHYVWRSVSAHDVAEMLVSVGVAYGVTAVIAVAMKLHLPRSIYFIVIMNQCVLHIGVRCVMRFWTMTTQKNKGTNGERLRHIGGGEAGRL